VSSSFGEIDAVSARVNFAERGLSMPFPKKYELPPLPVELARKQRITIPHAAQLRGISEAVFRKKYAHLIEQVSPKRQVAELGKVLDAE
jgi:hypothetical protein